MRTPWGESDGAERVARGITFYSTPSHGGYYLAPTVNERMPEALRLEGGWYEEDCDWARVVLAFPEYFKIEEQTQAYESLKNWCPRAFERFFHVTLGPGESFMLDTHPDRGLRW